MKSFLEWLEEQRQKRIAEDAVMAASATSSADSGVASPAAATQAATQAASCEISPLKACIGLTDREVLGGGATKKNSGFLGKGDFMVPKNVLSGDVEVRIDLKR